MQLAIEHVAAGNTGHLRIALTRQLAGLVIGDLLLDLEGRLLDVFVEVAAHRTVPIQHVVDAGALDLIGGLHRHLLLLINLGNWHLDVLRQLAADVNICLHWHNM